MTKGRDTAAVNVDALLEVARVQQRSGLIRIETSQAGFLEEGELYVLGGQPTYARTANLLGLEALNYLLGWRNIYFSFASNVPRPPTNIFFQPERGMAASLRANNQAFTPLPAAEPLWQNTSELEAVSVRKKMPGIESLVPHKREPERDIPSLLLTRRQRVIYFLIDGQRTAADLARTANKSMPEIELILSELQEQGLITF